MYEWNNETTTIKRLKMKYQAKTLIQNTCKIQIIAQTKKNVFEVIFSKFVQYHLSDLIQFTLALNLPGNSMNNI